MSSAFHADCADAPEAKRLLAALSPAEREDVLSWQKPATVMVNDCLLDYSSAEKELEVGLDVFGDFTAIVEEAIAWGHLDFAWVREVQGLRVAYVADIKKSIWTTPDGPDSLQLHAYGRAFAKKHGCDAYCTGIWAAEEGEWLWSMDIVMLDGPAGQAMWSRIAFAATHEGEFSYGDHCRACYAREHCPEWMLPPEAAFTSLAPFAIDKLTITSDIANKLLLESKRAKEMAEYVTKEIQELVRRGAIEVFDKDGKRYAPVQCKGKESADIDKVRELAPEAIKRGAPYDRFMFLKARAR